MGATITWIGGSGNSWHAAANWDLGRVPGAGDDVVVPNMTPDVNVTYSFGSTSINSLTCAEAFTLSNGALIIDAASTLNGAVTFSGGNLGGAGHVTINGLMSWTFATLLGTGVVNANGGIAISGDTFNKTLSQRTLNNAGLATFSGTGPLSINQGAVWNNLPGSTFEIQNTASITFTVGPAGSFNNSGTLRKTGAGTSSISVSVSNPGTIDVDAGTLSVAGALTNLSGTTLSGGTYDIAGIFRFPSTNIVTNAAAIILDGTASAIQNTSGVDALANFSTNAAAGRFQIKNGRNFVRTGPFSNAGQVIIGPGLSTLSATGNYVQSAGGTTLDGGTLDPTNLADIQGGELKGNGSILGSVTNAGACRVGLSPGRIFVSGDYMQAAAGLLEAEIGGLSPGAGGYDQLVVSGTASLAGTLDVLLFGGYQPDVGDSFDIVTAGTRSGSFATHNLPLAFSQNCKGAPEYGAAFVRINTYERVIISGQPDSQSICAGDPVTFAVSAGGSGPFTYQWRKSGVDIPGENGATFTVTNVQPGDAGDYDVIITNLCGFENSAIATLTVNVAPRITDDPDSQTRCSGSDVSFSVTATGVPTPTLQWRKDGVALGGETGMTLSLTNIQSSDGGHYDCVATNICGSRTTSPAVLTVNVPAAVLIDPDPIVVCASGNAIFSVTASGTPPLTYQWRKGGVDIAGATASTFAINTTQPTDAGDYDCVVTNVCGMDSSVAASLTVHASSSGDVNGDSLTDGGDLQAFVNVLHSGGPASVSFCAADMNADGAVDALDVPLFVALILAP